MIKTLNFIKLDFLTIKPFLITNWLVLSIVLIFTAHSPLVMSSILMISAMLISGYPFAVSENNDIDRLYPTLSINRKTVVLGRYLFIFTINIFMMILSLLLLFVIITLTGNEINQPLVLRLIGSLFLYCTICLAFQLPIYFKFGYSKSKLLVFVPFLAYPFLFTQSFTHNLVDSASILNILDQLTSNVIGYIIICILWIIIMCTSYKASLICYKRRDF